MKYLLKSLGFCFLVVFPISASQPGQPLSADDLVFMEPGLSAEVLLPRGSPTCGDSTTPPEASCALIGTDRRGVDGLAYFPYLQHSAVDCTPLRCNRWEIWKGSPGTSMQLVAYIYERMADPLHTDNIDELFVFGIDQLQGRMIVRLTTSSIGFNSPPLYEPGVEYVMIEGLGTLFEILQGYSPAASLTFHVPYMPEGLPSADHFDTYWGNVASLPDFTQAHPMACNYPATPPAVGDFLTVNDTSPVPPVGQANYIVTAVTRGTDRRYGRQLTGPTVTGRNPALLPACVQP